ncbi:MAG: hypothetical protein MJY61_05215 [Bacteroidales bacterium]|nr:hypothetical protein [Bacteroidales bacterium]
MKKSLIFVSVLAFVGLFASCQKENVSAPEQTAEQKVITIDPNGFKGDADIEPLIALSQALNQEVVPTDEKQSRVREILREFFSVLGDLVGSSESTTSRNIRYFGNWKTFGAAIAEIQGLSYDARVPYIKLELGNATDVKIGKVEVMPFTDFRFEYVDDFSSEERVTPIDPLEPIIDPLEPTDSLAVDTAKVVKAIYGSEGHIAPEPLPIRTGTKTGLYNGLIVKFTYRHSTYAFVINVEAEEGKLKDYADYLVLNVGYGHYIPAYDTLAEWYQAYMSRETGSLPISYSTQLYYYTYFDIENYLWIYHNGLSLNIDTFEDGRESSPAAFLRVGYGLRHDDNRYYQLFSESLEPEAAKEFYHDYLWAEAFGCSQSEIGALQSEYQQTFRDRVWLFGYTPDGEKATFRTNLTIGAQAKALRWKPVLGFSYECAEGTVFAPFEELTQFDYESTDFKEYWKYLFENTSVSGFNPLGGWYTDFDN